MIFRILEDQYGLKLKEAKAADQRFMQLALSLGRADEPISSAAGRAA